MRKSCCVLNVNFDSGQVFKPLFPFDISKLIQPGGSKFNNIRQAGFGLNVAGIISKPAHNSLSQSTTPAYFSLPELT